MLTPREIIAEAWSITTHEKPVRRWGLAAAFFETFLDIKLVAYQLYFLYAYLIHREVGFFDDFEWLYSHASMLVFFSILISFLLLLAVEWIFPHLAAGAIIGLGAKSYGKEPVKGGIILAFYNFFPVFAAHEVFILASWSMSLTACSLILRYGSGDIRFPMVGVIIIVWLLSNALKFMASFTEQGIVIKKESVANAMGKSFKLLISHLGHVMFLMLLLFIITLRIFINLTITLLIPLVVGGIGLLLLHFLSPLIAYIISGCIAIVLVGVASYFFGYLHIFRTMVWTITYLEFQKEKELDKIG